MSVRKIQTATGKEFTVYWAKPIASMDDMIFMARIRDADPEVVHEIFKDPQETSSLTVLIEKKSQSEVIGTYAGYTKYLGFNIESDGGVIVTLKKQL